MKFLTGSVNILIVLVVPIVVFISFFEAQSENRKNKSLVFLSDRDRSNREFDLYIMDLDTLKPINLTGPIREVSVRSNSLPKLDHIRNSVFFISFNPRSLVELNPVTRTVKKITDIRYEAADYCISPDGNSVVYTEKEGSAVQLFGIDLVRGGKRNLSNNRFNNVEASYSHDGSRVVYVCDQDGSNSIAIMNRDGSNQKVLTNAFGDDRYPKFSPDDATIVFSSSRSGMTDSDYDLFTIDATGGNFTLFHDSNAFDTQPDFFPDNGYVAFVSDARGPSFRDIFLKDLKTGSVNMVTSGLSYFSGNFHIGEDGRFIVFENTGPADSEIYLYEIHGQKMRNITRHPSRDISPSL